MASVATSVGLPIMVNTKCANVDYKFGPYNTLSQATSFLVAAGYAVAGLEFGVKQSDGSVKRYEFISDSQYKEQVGGANYIDIERTDVKVDVSLCIGDESDKVSTASIPAASANGAGVMSVDDKQTLSTLESNAPKTITVNAKDSEVELKMSVVRGSEKTVSIPAATTTSSGVMSKADKAALNSVIASVASLVYINGSNFIGIVSTVPTNAPSSNYAWCLVGEDLTSLKLYTYSNNAWSKFSDKEYDLSDSLASRIIEVDEAGFFIVDSQYRIGMSVTTDGVKSKNIHTYRILD